MYVRGYHAQLTWELPELTAHLPAGAELRTDVERATTTHFDTVDRALGLLGITVSNTGSHCLVQLPDGGFAGPAASPRSVPRDVQAVLLGARGGRRLIPVGSSESLRRVTRIVDPDGTVQATIVDTETIGAANDGVEVVQARRMVTVDTDAEHLHKALHSALRKSGATSRHEPELSAEPVVALTAQSPDEHVAKPDQGTLGRLITEYLDVQREALLYSDVALRRGEDAVHATRVAARRYRSAVQVFGAALDTERAAALTSELRWFAQLLGDVRDPQVRRDRLSAALDGVDPAAVLGRVAERIYSTLLDEQLRARTHVDRAMRSKRYLALLDELSAWHAQPPFTRRALRGEDDAVRYVRKAERALRRRLRGAKSADDTELHSARKAAKRLRYAAELAEPVLAKRVRHIGNQAKKLQTVLGDYLDAKLACSTLRRLAATTAGSADENGFTFGVLYAVEEADARAARERALRLS